MTAVIHAVTCPIAPITTYLWLSKLFSVAYVKELSYLMIFFFEVLALDHVSLQYILSVVVQTAVFALERPTSKQFYVSKFELFKSV